jgi:hypothetical protein
MRLELMQDRHAAEATMVRCLLRTYASRAPPGRVLVVWSCPARPPASMRFPLLLLAAPPVRPAAACPPTTTSVVPLRFTTGYHLSPLRDAGGVRDFRSLSLTLARAGGADLPFRWRRHPICSPSSTLLATSTSAADSEAPLHRRGDYAAELGIWFEPC